VHTHSRCVIYIHTCVHVHAGECVTCVCVCVYQGECASVIVQPQWAYGTKGSLHQKTGGKLNPVWPYLHQVASHTLGPTLEDMPSISRRIWYV
jgi:hypothetical protein